MLDHSQRLYGSKQYLSFSAAFEADMFMKELPMARQGRHGEAHFAAICQSDKSVADATLNESAADMHGWDFVIDIEGPKSHVLPLDLQQPLIQCFAQIKTTKGKKLSTKIKLSNAMKAAKSSTPFFIFLIHYARPGEDPIIYGRHIWREEISDFLRTARNLNKENSIQPHKRIITFAFNQKDRLMSAPPDWMLDQIFMCGGEDYSDRKRTIVKSVGYDEIVGEAKIEIGPLSTVSDIVLHEIGVLKDLPVSSLKYFDRGFGVLSDVPSRVITEGRLSFANEGRSLTLKITSSQGDHFSIPAKGWTPKLVSADDPEYRVRVNAGHLDFIWSQNPANQALKLMFDTEISLPFLQHLGFLKFATWSKSGDLTLSVESDIGVLLSGRTVGTHLDGPWLEDYCGAAEELLKIIGPERCAEVVGSFSDLSSSYKEIHFVSKIFNAGSLRIEAIYNEIVGGFDSMLGYVWGELGPWTYGAIYEMKHGATSAKDLRQTFYFSDPKLVSSFAFKQPVEITRNQVLEQFERLRSDLSYPTAVIQDGNLRAWTNAFDGKKEFTISVD